MPDHLADLRVLHEIESETKYILYDLLGKDYEISFSITGIHINESAATFELTSQKTLHFCVSIYHYRILYLQNYSLSLIIDFRTFPSLASSNAVYQSSNEYTALVKGFKLTFFESNKNKHFSHVSYPEL